MQHDPAAMLRHRITGRPDPVQPKPPGHPETWGLLTRGTILDGSPYTPPVDLPTRRPALAGGK